MIGVHFFYFVRNQEQSAQGKEGIYAYLWYAYVD